jgi:tripartite-type tricarboxylate transporter receptor subunit TctC
MATSQLPIAREAGKVKTLPVRTSADTVSAAKSGDSMITRRRSIKLAAAAMAASLPRAALAQAPWPSRFVKLVVPFAAGGANEAFARNLATKLSDIWGQQVVIENKPGAGGNLGAEMVARAEPDGYTMLIASFPHAVNRFLYPSIGYDLLADFAPVTVIGATPNLMVVPNSSPANTVADFIAHAKSNPGKVSFASSGAGTSIHLSGELFKRVTGIDMTHIPYRGGAPALADLIPGRVDLMFNVMSSVLPQVRGGQMRGLAVTTPRRVAAAAEFPTMIEAGVPNFVVTGWFGFMLPAKTPPEIVRKVHADSVAAINDPAVKERLEALGIVIEGSSPDEFSAFLRREADKWGPVIKEAGIRVGTGPQ